MRANRCVCLCVRAFILTVIVLAAAAAEAQSPLQFVATPAPCRVVDTRNPNGPFGGPPIQGGTARNFALPNNPSCGVPSTAAAYSLNVTVVPHGPLGYLTVWPAGQMQPVVSTLNSLDGRTKANAAIVPAGTGGAISVFASNTTDVVLDIDGYFIPAVSSALAFYPLTPCRIVDTRGGSPLQGGVPRDFSVQGECDVPLSAQAYSLNFTAVPHGHPLGYLTVWPTGQSQPGVSTLNAPTGTTTANAAIVQAGTDGDISVFASNTTDLVIDVDGFFASPGAAGELSLFPLPPCRVLDTRPNGQFDGELTVQVQGTCGVPPGAGAYVLNATVVPPGPLGYLTLWPDGEPQPVVSTLNALDGAVTSNMAIVPTNSGLIDAFASNPTQLVVDVFSYLAALPPLIITTTSLPGGTTGQPYQASLAASGGEPPYTWSLSSGVLPPGLTLSNTGVISGIPTSGGVYSFTVQVADSENHSTTAQLSITVATGSLNIVTTQLPPGTQGVAYEATLQAGGGTPPYMWSVVSGALPDGLMLDGNSGEITGTPGTVGVFNFTVQVEDSMMNTAQAGLQIIVNAMITNGSLNGSYAFSFNGYQNGSPVFMAGSFIADGHGIVTSGVLDLNTGLGSPQTGYQLTGIYTITANGLGTMSFTVNGLPDSLNFHVAVSTGGNGQLIQDNADPSTRGSGAFYVQATLDFHAPPAGGYAEGTFGADQDFNRYAKAGAFIVGANGVVTSGEEDFNDAGTLGNRVYTGHFTGPNSQTGRGQATFSFPGGVTNNYSYYVVSKNQFIIIGTDPLSGLDPLTLGSILSQAATSFTNGSLHGNGIYESSGLVPVGNLALSRRPGPGDNPEADILLGLFTADGSGNATIGLDENEGGSLTQHPILGGSYVVQADGRVTFSGLGGDSPILYLVNTNQGFALGQDAFVASGVLEPQTAPPPYSNASIIGTYLGGTLAPVTSPIVDAVSFLFADGNGHINGIQDYSGIGGIGTQQLAATYQVDSTGRTVDTGLPAGIMYIVSSKKVVLLPTGPLPVLSTFSLGLTN